MKVDNKLGKNVRHISSDAIDDSDYLFTLGKSTVTTVCKLGGVDCEFLIDSGACLFGYHKWVRNEVSFTAGTNYDPFVEQYGDKEANDMLAVLIIALGFTTRPILGQEQLRTLVQIRSAICRVCCQKEDKCAGDSTSSLLILNIVAVF